MWLPELDCIFQVGLDKGLVEWEHEFYALVVEVAGNESQYSVCRLTIFFFCHLRSLVTVIIRYRCSSVAICCWFAILQLCCMLL